jgi:hypothetical protein
MRAKLIGLLLGCGLLAARAAPAFACMFTNASADTQPPQHTAQAQTAPSDAQE